ARTEPERERNMIVELFSRHALQLAPEPASRGVPPDDLAVESRADHDLVAGCKGHAVDRHIDDPRLPQKLAGSGVPDANQAVGPPGGGALAVAGQGDTIGIGVIAVAHLDARRGVEI